MTPSTMVSAFAEDVRHYLQLTPRQLPSMYLYDALGSALFDAICELPWYAITRAEMLLLERHRTEIFAHLPDLTRLVELGPGDGRKLKTLVDGTSEPLIAHLVDVSAGALERAAHTLSDALNLSVVTHQAPFEDGLDAIMRVEDDAFGRVEDDTIMRQESGDRTLVLFLGSNIGNFDQRGSATLLSRIAASLAPGDAFLIGADLVKPEPDLQLAYDDPLGVSAAFNLNVLLRINRELGGNFDLRAFRHRAVWNAACSRMDMFLVSTREQRVRIEGVGLDFTLREGEGIWSESSYKYTPDGFVKQLRDSGFESMAQWTDRDAGFALTLARTA
ncbi:MAG TPA: L-histidine N(alpha)-methyltransferase [Vicinamibacterales bacterium]|nr:L-histidine N(alpha)-methyltransferase [Vicinamibacterales bacterium]